MQLCWQILSSLRGGGGSPAAFDSLAAGRFGGSPFFLWAGGPAAARAAGGTAGIGWHLGAHTLGESAGAAVLLVPVLYHTVHACASTSVSTRWQQSFAFDTQVPCGKVVLLIDSCVWHVDSQTCFVDALHHCVFDF